jgi:predicted nucleotidyltransferase
MKGKVIDSSTMKGNIERVLAALNSAGVRYVVVGGVAVVLHGVLRTTADLDMVVQLEPDNLKRALDALSVLGFRPRAPVPIDAFADEATRSDWIQDKGMVVFSLWHPDTGTFEIDLFMTEPFDFDDVHGRALRLELDQTTVIVIALPDLIALKRASGRHQDLADIESLEALSLVEGQTDEE